MNDHRWARLLAYVTGLVLFGEGSLRRALNEYLARYGERNHQGKRNALLFPETHSRELAPDGIKRNQRLGGLLNYYSRAA